MLPSWTGVCPIVCLLRLRNSLRKIKCKKLTQQCQFDFSRTAFMDMIHFSTNFYYTATIVTKLTLQTFQHNLNSVCIYFCYYYISMYMWYLILLVYPKIIIVYPNPSASSVKDGTSSFFFPVNWPQTRGKLHRNLFSPPLCLLGQLACRGGDKFNKI